VKSSEALDLRRVSAQRTEESSGMSEPSEKRSQAEEIKEGSRHLRGTIAESLSSGAAGFGEADQVLLKFHGIYQGHDRDEAKKSKAAGGAREKAVQFMVRARLPAGVLSAEQYLALDDLAGRYANGSLRVTTRQSIQFHGVLMKDLKEHIGAMNQALVTTIAACGDVVRNVVTVPAPIKDALHQRLEADAKRLSEVLSPRSGAYHEIWVDGEPVAAPPSQEPEPLYGRTYLPRKFKVALGTPRDNSIDVLSNDLAIIALLDGDEVARYLFCLGGGMGTTHHNAETYPRLATPIALVPPELLVEAAEASVKLARDHGDRANRKHARLKYVIEEKGAAWARQRLEEYLGRALEAPVALPHFEVVDHLGWHEQGDGRLYLGVPLPAGRISDAGGSALRTALREVVQRFRARPILTPNQDILLSEIDPRDRFAVGALLRVHGVALAEDLLPVKRWALACPALPTCGLALTESERVREPIVADIARALAAHGLEREPISVRMTGCANGCARPFGAEVGIVGRTPGHYSVFVGGSFEGVRLGRQLLDKVPQARLADALEPLFALFASERKKGERFGDFCARQELERLVGLASAVFAARAG
jgi:sulfite reductase (ferredoxin)